MATDDIEPQIEKAIVWTDPKIHRSYFWSMLFIALFSYLFVAFFNSDRFLSFKGVLNTIYQTMFMLGVGWTISQLSYLGAMRKVKIIKDIVKDPCLKPVKVKVMPQTKLWLAHSKKLNGPGVRKAVDDNGKSYDVCYRELLEEEFEGKLYKLSWSMLPYPFIQKYIVIPSNQNKFP
jgi:hypothetical protein